MRRSATVPSVCATPINTTTLGFHVLLDEHRTIKHDDGRPVIAGVTDYSASQFKLARCPPVDANTRCRLECRPFNHSGINVDSCSTMRAPLAA